MHEWASEEHLSEITMIQVKRCCLEVYYQEKIEVET